ncbi:hypothetical protein I3843_16G019400 [Carya illinoinensis]|uniref:Ribosome maturation factor RimP N-terminal domain-containing protein n=1 Tax=Carya illinoinensis TaxID=32201 RepID=A0A8T1N3N9_CARIL|nr:uncharacterized protein LOC122299298 isoform X1 [Carya illinoinensis]KAG6624311.1 hypothetical protein CIPAW_16G017600 [Carya illinoinensis]KAG6671677.1 hypothetical protein I3842_16G016100 [Carya illinoinensis]KAG7941056.1 hypothetical protein I3843_16G019400 [Carya illinoinensis]
MNLIASWNLRTSEVSFPPTITMSSCFCGRSLSPYRNLQLPFWTYPFPYTPNRTHIIGSGKRDSEAAEPVLKPSIVEEVSLVDEEDEALFDDFEDETTMDDVDDYFAEEYEEDNAEVCAGDGGGGGGISLAGTWWDEEALRMAEEVSQSFDGDLRIYAFKTMLNSTIQVRIEKLSNKSGSPSMEDIEAFSATYRARLDEAELSKSIPESISLEVSSPGVERVVRIPHDLDRFKDRPMYVKYVNQVAANSSSVESDGVFRLVSFDMESKCCTWGLANVRVNREKAGKGRPLSKKQREWRLNTPFDSLCLVRLYSDI